jgi:glycosyltransferase involved in cell wall biosynthesis
MGGSVGGQPQALFVSYTAAAGGAEGILLDQAAALPGPVAIACPGGALAQAARARGLAVVTLRERRTELRASVRDRLGAPARIAAQAREVRRAVADLRPRCLVGWSMRGLLVAVGALAGLRERPPLVFQHNDLLPSPAVGRVVRAAASRASRVVCLCNAIAEDLDPRGRLGVEVIYPGVDLERFTPTPVPDGPPLALVLGAIVDWKRPDLALDAAALARRELPGLRVRLAGAPFGTAGAELEGRLRDRATADDLAGAVELVGRVDDVPAALAGATCLLHCADREPFGMALVEALASGRPVAAPSAGGPVEIVDRSCGRLFAPGDAGDAAAALVDVARRAPQLSAPARARAESMFDVRRSTARFRDLIAQVAE